MSGQTQAFRWTILCGHRGPTSVSPADLPLSVRITGIVRRAEDRERTPLARGSKASRRTATARLETGVLGYLAFLGPYAARDG